MAFVNLCLRLRCSSWRVCFISMHVNVCALYTRTVARFEFAKYHIGNAMNGDRALATSESLLEDAENNAGRAAESQ